MIGIACCVPAVVPTEGCFTGFEGLVEGSGAKEVGIGGLGVRDSG